MYWLFVRKDITPGQFYAMPLGEKIILRAFVNKMLSEKG